MATAAGKGAASDQVTTSVAEDNRVAVGDGGKSLIARDNSVINFTSDKAFNLVDQVVSDYADMVKAKDAAATGLSLQALQIATSAAQGDTPRLIDKAIQFGLPALAIYAAIQVMK